MNFAILPIEIIQNLLYFLSLPQLWRMISINKRIQHIALDVITKRLRLTFQQGGLKLMFEIFVEQSPKDMEDPISIRLLGNFSHIDSNTFHVAFNLCSLPDLPSSEKAVFPSSIISSILGSPINDITSLESVGWCGHDICKITVNINLIHESSSRPLLLSSIIPLEDETSFSISYIDLQYMIPNAPSYRHNFVSVDGDILQKMFILVGVEQSTNQINTDLEGCPIWFVQAIFRSKILCSIDE